MICGKSGKRYIRKRSKLAPLFVGRQVLKVKKRIESDSWNTRRTNSVYPEVLNYVVQSMPNARDWVCHMHLQLHAQQTWEICFVLFYVAHFLIVFWFPVFEKSISPKLRFTSGTEVTYYTRGKVLSSKTFFFSFLFRVLTWLISKSKWWRVEKRCAADQPKVFLYVAVC